MAISQYYVGAIPSRPISIEVRDSEGSILNLSSSKEFKVILLDSDNRVVDLRGSTLLSGGAASGRFVFRFPTDRSLFTKPGEYLLQLEIVGANGTRDFTTEHHIKVKRLGGTN